MAARGPAPDPSSFYRLNEEIAGELQRLAQAGHLERLQELLAGAESELLVTSMRPGEGLEEVIGALRPAPEAEAGWDHEGFLTARSRFTVVYPDGSAGEVYMPDHVCPVCWNDEGNQIKSCSRVCDACDFSW